MNSFVDWNARLLPCTSGYLADSSQSIQAMQEMVRRFGFDSFCVTADFDCFTETVAMFLLRFSRFQSMLKGSVPHGVQIKSFASVLLLPNLSQIPDLHKLLFSSQKLLPIKLPICNYEDWMDLEFNRLLYKNKFQLLFTSFEVAIVLYPSDIIEKLIRISHAVFQFNYRSLTNPKVCAVIKKLIAQKNQVLLGTALDSLDKIYFYEFDYYLNTARLNFSAEEYRILLDSNRRFWMV